MGGLILVGVRNDHYSVDHMLRLTFSEIILIIRRSYSRTYGSFAPTANCSVLNGLIAMDFT